MSQQQAEKSEGRNESSVVMGRINRCPALSRLVDMLERKRVWRANMRYYYFASSALFFFFLQFITGALLMSYYVPTSEGAYDSVFLITCRVDFGRTVRSLHLWSSHFMLACVLLHLISVFHERAYRPPRQFLWLGGLLMLILLLMSAFTGTLLPWDQRAYAAFWVGSEIAGELPFVGGFLSKLMRGADSIGTEALLRTYAAHVVVLPLATVLLLVVHLLLVQVHQPSKPLEKQLTGEDNGTPDASFLREYSPRCFLVLFALFNVALALSVFCPAGLGKSAQALGTTQPPKPEWYFLFFYEALRLMPAEILGVSGTLFLLSALGLVFAVFALLPFLEPKTKKPGRHLAVTIFGALLLSAISILTILGALG